MSNPPSLTTPREIDTALRDLYLEALKASQKLEANTHYLVSATNPDYYYKGRKRATDRTLGEALDLIEAALAAYDAEHPDGGDEWDKLPALNNGEAINAPTAERVRRLLADREALTLELASLRAKTSDLNRLYTGWSRFFVVTSSNGHVHKSMSCSSCFYTTTYGPMPELSGQTEADAVDALGSNLCSVCFPSAPVEHQGGKFTQAEAEKIAAGGLKVAREIRAKKAAAEKDACPGSGKPFADQFRGGRYGKCRHCHTTQAATSAYSGVARKHKAPKAVKA
jgi:hypothetical protein